MMAAGAPTLLKGCGKFALGIFVMLLPFVTSNLSAQETLSPRLQIGIGLLPAVIAANKSLQPQNNGASLPIYLVYRNNRQFAERLEPGLRKIKAIRGYSLAINKLSLEQLLESNPVPMSTIFIVEPIDDELDNLISFSQQRRLLLFSPFKGDVERGAMTGFKVTDKVLPMVNIAALRESNIQLKAFFLRIAVKYE